MNSLKICPNCVCKSVFPLHLFLQCGLLWCASFETNFCVICLFICLWLQLYSKQWNILLFHVLKLWRLFKENTAIKTVTNELYMVLGVRPTYPSMQFVATQVTWHYVCQHEWALLGKEAAGCTRAVICNYLYYFCFGTG